MRVLVFGATGMVGLGVLRECLVDPGVEAVVTVGRAATGQSHPKLREVVHRDLRDLRPVERELTGFDACFYSLGVTSVGMPAEQYRAITYDLTIAVARTLVRLNPGMTFIYVSGMGTDSSEQGRSAWARVKGATENEILRLGFKAACAFRPAMIVPENGIRSKTWWYQAVYDVMRPMLPLMFRWMPRLVTTTGQMGRAMIRVAREGPPKRVLENLDINRL
jgi:uncharacterized protein YbjT (DUF2867 family)